MLRTPAMKNGQLISAGTLNRNPTKTGAVAAPIVLAIPVIPAAADIFLCVRLAEGETSKQDRYRSLNVRHQRNTQEEDIRRKMREDHGLNKTNSSASLDANSAEMPARRFAPKNMLPRTDGSVWNRR